MSTVKFQHHSKIIFVTVNLAVVMYTCIFNFMSHELYFVYYLNFVALFIKRGEKTYIQMCWNEIYFSFNQ